MTPGELRVVTVLPPATVGVPYLAELSAEGGLPPYAWEADGLPPGLAIEEERVTGTAEQYGAWTVTLAVTDAEHATAVDGQVLTVQAEEVPLPPGADPALAYPRADVEWIVYQAVRDLGGTVDWALSATERDPRTWITVTGVQVDVRAATKGLAADRADLVRRAVAALPWAAAASGVVAAVDVLAGPFWEPDATGAPRYVVRFGVTSHPPRRGAAPHPAARGPVDPVLRFARPSVELAVRHAVRDLGGTVTWCYAAADRQPRGWLAAVDVQVDVRANSKSTAWRRADACRRAVSLLPWAAQPHGVIASVDVTDGPFWLPDPDGRPRYVARYAILTHPSRPARQVQGVSDGNRNP
jgi:hypothetical protein